MSKIAETLEDARPDMAVSLWLQEKTANGTEGLPQSVVAAYQVDKFLQEINSGGFGGFFSWEFDNVFPTLSSLRRVDLPDVASILEEAMNLVGPEQIFENREAFDQAYEELRSDENRSAQMNALDQKAIAQSARIEKATHAFVRENLSVFETLDN